MRIPRIYHFQTCVLSVQTRRVRSPIVRRTPAIKVSHSQIYIEKNYKLWFIFTDSFPDFLNQTMVFVESSSFLKFFYCRPELFTGFWISLKISLDVVGHTFSKFGNSTSAHTIHIYESCMIELINERQSIPEEIAHFELEFVMIFFRETLSYLLYLIL